MEEDEDEDEDDEDDEDEDDEDEYGDSKVGGGGAGVVDGDRGLVTAVQIYCRSFARRRSPAAGFIVSSTGLFVV